MTNEQDEDVPNGLAVFKRYLVYLQGWRFIVLSQLCMGGFTAFKILSDYQVGNWASSPEQSTHFLYYSGLTFLFASINSFFTFGRVAVMQGFGWRATRRLH